MGETVAQEAERMVSGDRREQYGPPVQHFEQVARVWSVLLDVNVDAEDVALCMAALKLIRESYSQGRDNRVDAIGYLIIADEIVAASGQEQ